MLNCCASVFLILNSSLYRHCGSHVIPRYFMAEVHGLWCSTFPLDAWDTEVGTSCISGRPLFHLHVHDDAEHLDVESAPPVALRSPSHPWRVCCNSRWIWSGHVYF